MELQFLGAAGTVTGSKTLLRTASTQVLVDCGMFQGLKELRMRNRDPFPFAPAQLDAVLLTHAHLDHSGLIPALVKAGFDGPIYCTPATQELLKLLLPDSGHLQEEDAAYANRKRFTKHQPAEPLYTEKDARRSLRSLRPVEADTPISIGDLQASFRSVGHILGASCVRVENSHTSVLFSGDVGRSKDILMCAPAVAEAADYVVIESTYGDRRHEKASPLDVLADAIERTVSRGGVVLIPAFAVGRAQALIYALYLLKQKGRIADDLPIFLNSPMAVNATALYRRYPNEHVLSAKEANEVFSSVTLIHSVDDSKELNDLDKPAVIISAAGMLSGGRVLHHLRAYAPQEKNTLIFSGFQAAGSRGRSILAGAGEVKIHGRMVPVRCEIVKLGGLSAHADSEELVDWLRALKKPPQRVFVNHGEPSASDALRRKIRDDLDWDVSIPAIDERFTLVGAAEAAERPASELATPIAQEPPAFDREAAVRAIVESPTYLRAEEDVRFLSRDELRPARLMLEYMKPQKALDAAQILATIVVWGGTRIIERTQAEERLARARAQFSLRPDDEARLRTVEAADRLLVKSRYYDEARRFARLASREAFDGTHIAKIVTGGGPGIMEAANRGAHDEGAESLGFNITLPREQRPNPWVSPHLCFQFRYFALRKMHFLLRARALVAFPGGYGTFDELFDCLCLIQTKKMSRMPVVLVGREFWSRAFDERFLAEEGVIAPEDLDLFCYAETAEEAWGFIRAYYKRAAVEAETLACPGHAGGGGPIDAA